MAKQIKYIDSYNYFDQESERDRIDEHLKNYQIINIETLEKVIRFWYNKEE